MKRWARAAMAAILAAMLLMDVAAAAGVSASQGIMFDYRWGYFDSIKVKAAWDAGLTGDGVTVAVLDTGIYGNHVELQDRITEGKHYYYRAEDEGKYIVMGEDPKKRFNYYSNDDIQDNDGHGTAMAGIILSVAPNVTIMPIRCIGDEIPGEWDTSASRVISGINFAVNHGADVINMSFKIYGRKSEKLQEAITNATDAGVIVVASAGNDGSQILNYPAAYEGVIGVGSVNEQGALSDFSNRNDSVDICATGEAVWSLGTNGKFDFDIVSGTSCSAATVSGAAALMKERYPEMTCGEFEELLKSSRDPLEPGADGTVAIRAGRLNVQKLLREKQGRDLMDALERWKQKLESIGSQMKRRSRNLESSENELKWWSRILELERGEQSG